MRASARLRAQTSRVEREIARAKAQSEFIRQRKSGSNVAVQGSSMRTLSSTSRSLEDTILEEVAYQLQRSRPDQDAWQAVFRSLDRNGSGNLSKMELLDGLEKLGCSVSTADVASLVRRFDRDGDGLVSYREFVRELGRSARSGHRPSSRADRKSLPPSSHPMEDDFISMARRIVRSTGATSLEALRKVFRSVDTSRSGKLSRDELRRALGDAGYKPSVREAELLMKRLDSNRDGSVDWHEFVDRIGQITGVFGDGEREERRATRSLLSASDRREDSVRYNSRRREGGMGWGEDDSDADRDTERGRARGRDLEPLGERGNHGSEQTQSGSSEAANKLAKDILQRLLVRIGEAAYDRYGGDARYGASRGSRRGRGRWGQVGRRDRRSLLRKAFDSMDVDGDRALGEREILRMVQGTLGVSLSREESGALMQHLDKDGSGEVELQEFIDAIAQAGLDALAANAAESAASSPRGPSSTGEQAMLALVGRIARAARKKRVWSPRAGRSGADHRSAFLKAFKGIDADGSGRLTRREIERAMGELGYDLQDERREADLIMRHFDTDGTGSISYKEFVDALVQAAAKEAG